MSELEPLGMTDGKMLEAYSDESDDTDDAGLVADSDSHANAAAATGRTVTERRDDHQDHVALNDFRRRDGAYYYEVSSLIHDRNAIVWIFLTAVHLHHLTILPYRCFIACSYFVLDTGKCHIPAGRRRTRVLQLPSTTRPLDVLAPWLPRLQRRRTVRVRGPGSRLRPQSELFRGLLPPVRPASVRNALLSAASSTSVHVRDRGGSR